MREASRRSDVLFRCRWPIFANLDRPLQSSRSTACSRGCPNASRRRYAQDAPPGAPRRMQYVLHGTIPLLVHSSSSRADGNAASDQTVEKRPSRRSSYRRKDILVSPFVRHHGCVLPGTCGRDRPIIERVGPKRSTGTRMRRTCITAWLGSGMTFWLPVHDPTFQALPGASPHRL